MLERKWIIHLTASKHNSWQIWYHSYMNIIRTLALGSKPTAQWCWEWVKLTGRTQRTRNQTLTFLSVTLAWTHSHFSCRLRRSSSVVLSWPSGVMAKICCPRSRSCLYISSLASSVLQSSYKHTERHHVHWQPDKCWLFKELLLMFECKYFLYRSTEIRKCEKSIKCFIKIGIFFFFDCTFIQLDKAKVWLVLCFSSRCKFNHKFCHYSISLISL